LSLVARAGAAGDVAEYADALCSRAGAGDIPQRGRYCRRNQSIVAACGDCAVKVQLKLARVGMNMSEATIVRWHKKPGESFALGEPLYEIETEKVSMDVEAPGAGTLIEIN